MEYLNVSTTQNVELEYQIASVGDRILAFLFDLLVIIIWSIFWAILLSNTIGFHLWQIILLIPVVFYSLLCEIFMNGQSFGKLVLKIQVVRLDGAELSFGSCLIRWLFRFPEMLITQGILPLLMVVINGKGQRLGDLAAKTTVLKIDHKAAIEDTAFVYISEEYQPVYSQAENLSDQDAQTIKEVLQYIKKDNDYGYAESTHPLIQKTGKVLLDRLNISDAKVDKDFLLTLLKDYNYYHR